MNLGPAVRNSSSVVQRSSYLFVDVDVRVDIIIASYSLDSHHSREFPQVLEYCQTPCCHSLDKHICLSTIWVSYVSTFISRHPMPVTIVKHCGNIRILMLQILSPSFGDFLTFHKGNVVLINEFYTIIIYQTWNI